MSSKIEVSKVLIRNDEKKFLVVQKSNKYDWKANKWELPGGKIQRDKENRFEAAKREVETETGLKIKDLQDLVRVETEEFKEGKPTVNCFIIFADKFSGEIELSSEHKDFKWVKANTFLEMNWHRDAGYGIPAIKCLNSYLK